MRGFLFDPDALCFHGGGSKVADYDVSEEASLAKHSSYILEMARKGAEHKYQELKAEIASLVKTFPHLARAGKDDMRRAVEPFDGLSTRPRRKRRSMSAAAKKAVSLRMKKYWADRRKSRKQ